MILVAKKKAAYLGIAALFAVGVIYQTRMVLCATDSLDGINGMIASRTSQLNRGDFAYIKGHKNALFKKDFVKRVVGLPGDTIVLKGDCLWVANRCVGKLLNKTRNGLPLTPIAEGVVPPGHIFVGGDHERSFDSRYQEFGLVKQSEVWGKGAILW